MFRTSIDYQCIIKLKCNMFFYPNFLRNRLRRGLRNQISFHTFSMKSHDTQILASTRKKSPSKFPPVNGLGGMATVVRDGVMSLKKKSNRGIKVLLFRIGCSLC